MTTLLGLILAFATAAGQLIRVPFARGGITILDITVALFCLGGLLKTKLKLRKPPPQITAALIFISLATVSLLLTPLHLNSSEYITSFSYTIRFLTYILFAWLLISDAFGSFSQNLKKAFLLSGISFAILGLLQFIFFPNLESLSLEGWDPHYFRTVSTFLDPNFAGAFLVLTLILLAHLRYVRIPPQVWVRLTPKVFNLIFASVYLALLTTFSRSSYLMFLISGLAFSFLRKSKSLGLACLLLFAILLSGFQIYSNLVAKPRNIDREQSASSRLNTWQQGLYLFQKFPILGVGFNAYRYGIKEYNLGDMQFLESHGSSSNDSSLLFVASTTGVIGIISYIYFLYTLVCINYSNNRYIFLPAILGLLVHSIFANSLFYPPILAWILLIGIIPKK